MSEYDVKRALKRREELRDQYARLRRTGKERAARRKQIESEIQKILAEQRAALLVGEREQTNVDLGAFEARVEALRRELEEISAKGQAGKAAASRSRASWSGWPPQSSRPSLSMPRAWQSGRPPRSATWRRATGRLTRSGEKPTRSGANSSPATTVAGPAIGRAAQMANRG